MHVVFEKEKKNDRYFCKGLKKKHKTFLVIIFQIMYHTFFFLISAWSRPKKHMDQCACSV